MLETKLIILKNYINTNLISSFIKKLNNLAGASILFIKKKDGSLKLIMDYCGLNIITIKNKYLLFFISEMLNRFIGIKKYIKLNLMTTYNKIYIKVGEE